MAAAARVTAVNGGVRFGVHTQPRASTNEVVGLHGTAVKIRVTGPAVDGAANDSLIDFLAKSFVVPRRAVRIVGGVHSRSKIVEVDGISVDDVQRLLVNPG